MELFFQFLSNTGYYLADYRNVIMIVIGSLFLYLGSAKHYEPLLLIPIGFGILEMSLFSRDLDLEYMKTTVCYIICISLWLQASTLQ
ncbi:MAG: hypothetical protein SRB2_00797 [Desulfobacteraceae bacterium Eth-SRB2]|nr:MAG: hypothetical protein SRB2_00797 [Desulfobacteraceae bacterium Eth-SRB2]